MVLKLCTRMPAGSVCENGGFFIQRIGDHLWQIDSVIDIHVRNMRLRSIATFQNMFVREAPP